MAYFAQNKYDLALEDFESSVNYQADNFKSLYYIGIVYSVKGENEKAIEYYEKVLEVEPDEVQVNIRMSKLQKERK